MDPLRPSLPYIMAPEAYFSVHNFIFNPSRVQVINYGNPFLSKQYKVPCLFYANWHKSWRRNYVIMRILYEYAVRVANI